MVDLRGFKGIQPTNMVDFSRGLRFQEISGDFWPIFQPTEYGLTYMVRSRTSIVFGS